MVSQEEGVVCYLVIITLHIIDLVSHGFEIKKKMIYGNSYWEKADGEMFKSSVKVLLLNTEL